jgi:hypothetical protein
MPRLSLYKPEKGNDYKFIDRQASEMFQAGGTDVYLHKYVGTEATDANGNVVAKDHTQIQDLMFLENRDRKYDSSVYRIRGMYNVQNIDFNLSQFGLFIDNDTLFMTVHINDFIKYIGRKPMSGDVLELPHLKDTFALNEFDVGLPRYYVIEDVGRASEGFSVTWYPHLYRLKLKKITDSQQFADIFKQTALDANGDPMKDGTTLKDLLSTFNKEIAINDAEIAEAEANAPKSGYETRQFYTLAVDPTTGKPRIETADETTLDASNASTNAAIVASKPVRTGYTGYLVGDGWAPNGLNAGAQFGHGIQFPDAPGVDDYFLRTDFLPNRLFRFDGTRWVRVEDSIRMTMTNNDQRQTLKTSFINNTTAIYNDAVAFDYIKLTANQYSFDTAIDITTAAYVVLKLDTVEIAYDTATYPTMISDNNGKVHITLPVINSVQQAVPYDGAWKLTLANNKVDQRQSLSKVLRPRADL